MTNGPIQYKGSPCKDCSDRQVGCHGSCEKYRAYKDYQETIAERRRMENSINQMVVTGALRRNYKK